MGNLLEVNNLSISFTQYVEGLNRHDLKVISDLTLDVNEAEIVAILGSSGSGKSLLAHSILGILPYNSHVTGEQHECRTVQCGRTGDEGTVKRKGNMSNSSVCEFP